MPYRHAHYYLLALFPLTLFAFWPGYFSDLRGAAYSAHVHGVTASLWIALLAMQSWSIHRRQNALHRTLGYSSFVLFPLFTVGGLLVIQTMAMKFTAGVSPFYNVFAPGLALLDGLSTLAVPCLFFMALKNRRKVHRHGAYMLATVFFLLAPITTRILSDYPPFAVTGPETFHRFGWALHFSNLMVVLLLLELHRRHPKSGRAFLVTAGLVAAQSLLFAFVAPLPLWRGLFASIATVPLPVLVSLGFAVSGAVAWAGWSSVPPRRRTAATSS